MTGRLVISLVFVVACSRGSAPRSPHARDETAESRAQTEALAQPSAVPASPHGPSPHAATSPSPEPAAIPFDPANPAAAGMRWTMPSGFTYRAPESEMRLAEYVVGRANGADIAMTVFHFPGMGGSIDANLERWIGQFSQADGSSTLAATRVATANVGGMRVTTIDVGGRFEGGSMGGGSGDDYRLLGAIVEAPAGPVFFKLVGPKSVVDATEPGFRALVASFTRISP